MKSPTSERASERGGGRNAELCILFLVDNVFVGSSWSNILIINILFKHFRHKYVFKKICILKFITDNAKLDPESRKFKLFASTEDQ